MRCFLCVGVIVLLSGLACGASQSAAARVEGQPQVALDNHLVSKDVHLDHEQVMEDAAAKAAQTGSGSDDQSLYVTAKAQIDKADKGSSAAIEASVREQEHQAEADEKAAMDDARTLEAVEHLEKIAGIAPSDADLGEAKSTDTLEQLHAKAARAEEMSAQAEAIAEEAEIEKQDADQRVQEAAARHASAEQLVHKSRQAHMDATRAARKAEKKKRAADIKAQLSIRRAEAAAKVATELAEQQVSQQTTRRKLEDATVTAAHAALVKARTKAAEKVRKAEVAAYKTELVAHTEAVKQEAAASVQQAQQEADRDLELARAQAKSDLDQVKAKVLKQAELSKRAAAHQRLQNERLLEAHRKAAGLHSHDSPSTHPHLTQQSSPLDDAPEIAIAKLENKLHELQDVAAESSGSKDVNLEQLAAEASSNPAQGSKVVTADSLEEKAMKQMHLGIEGEVHEAASRSQDQLKLEAEAKAAEAQLSSEP